MALMGPSLRYQPAIFGALCESGHETRSCSGDFKSRGSSTDNFNDSHRLATVPKVLNDLPDTKSAGVLHLGSELSRPCRPNSPASTFPA